MSELTPEEIAGQQFQSRFRGFDPDQVRAFLTDVGEVLRALFSERDRLRARLGEFADRDLRLEFEAVGREVGTVLEAAREAAEAMRERAGAEAARWRSEALAESERQLRSARDDAERLRGDAWTAAEELLVQAMAEAERMSNDAKAEALRLVGEGERESHRLQAVAKREMEDLIRNARMEADRLTMAAQADYDAIIASARKEAEAAQERTRALEQRRDELKRELDSVRQSLSLAEGEVEERRDELGLAAPQPVERPEGKDETPPGWTVGETVRVVRPHETEDEPRDDDEPKAVGFPGGGIPTGPEIRILSPSELQERGGAADPAVAPDGDFPVFDEDLGVAIPDPASDALAPAGPAAEEPLSTEDSIWMAEPDPADSSQDTDQEVGWRFEPEAVDAGGTSEGWPEPATATDLESVATETLEAEPEVLEETAGEIDPAKGQQELFTEVEGLFARLRDPADVAADPAASADTDDAPPLTEASPEPLADRQLDAVAESPPLQDPFDLRERLLLPVTNRSLRNLKRQLTDEQNVALEELRLDEAGWVPNAASIRGRVRADLVVLLAESFGAGHSAAESLLGTRLSRPPTPRHEVADEFAQALTGEVEHVLAEGRTAGQGARQLGALVSRVFRAWRTDESERRIRHLSFSSYHEGLLSTLDLAGVDGVRFVVQGRGCATCRAAFEAEQPSTPPVHPGCGCTLIPV